LAAITWECSNSGTSDTNDGGVFYSEESPFIFGVSNPGGEQLMAAAGKTLPRRSR